MKNVLLLSLILCAIQVSAQWQPAPPAYPDDVYDQYNPYQNPNANPYQNPNYYPQQPIYCPPAPVCPPPVVVAPFFIYPRPVFYPPSYFKPVVFAPRFYGNRNWHHTRSQHWHRGWR